MKKYFKKIMKYGIRLVVFVLIEIKSFIHEYLHKNVNTQQKIKR